MSEIGLNPIDALRQAQQAAQASEQAASDELGRDQFLELLVTKLANQDPLAPSQDEEFIAQLAQFSSLEQLIEVNDGIGALAGGQANLLDMQAFGLIGKDALVESGGSLRVREGVPDSLVYAVPVPANSVQLIISDAQGETVETIDLDPTPRGRIDLDWDALDFEEPLADGDYQLSVNALDANGESMSIALFRSLPIEGVSFSEGFIQLISGDQVIDFASMLEIRSGSTSVE